MFDKHSLADYEAACFWAQELNVPKEQKADYIRRKQEAIRQDRERRNLL